MRLLDLSRSRGLMRLMKFGAVGATGILVNQLALWLGADWLSIYYVWAAVLATQVSSTWNFALTERFVFPSERAGRGRRLFWFTVMNNAWMVARLPLLWLLTERMGLHYLWSNLIAIVSATLLRFFVADRWIWASPAPQDQAAAEALDPRHYYDIHGIAAIASDGRLPELEAFRVESLDRPADIEVTITRDGFGSKGGRVKIEGAGERVSYGEKPKGFGFGMKVVLGTPVKVTVSRLVGRSPHVLYTNVIEPLLRWLFVRRGYALVHGACLEIGGKGVLITAQTDTGKTTTCLRTIREHGSGFLSDDMVIVSPDGTALNFPKPLTISAHTLGAISSAPLPFKQKLWLQIQSRLHSRTGRRFGMFMAALRMPVATMNAITQILVPPPKFYIDQLLPDAEVKKSLKLTHMIVIERGEAVVEPLGLNEATRVLHANTEDAYGFPPYPLVGEILAGESGFAEAIIHRSFLKRLESIRLRTPDRNWYQKLPKLVTNGHGANGNGSGRLIATEGRDPVSIATEETVPPVIDLSEETEEKQAAVG